MNVFTASSNVRPDSKRRSLPSSNGWICRHNDNRQRAPLPRILGKSNKENLVSLPHNNIANCRNRTVLT